MSINRYSFLALLFFMGACGGTYEEDVENAAQQLQNGKMELALKHLSQAILKKPDVATAYNMRGVVYFEMHDYLKAIQNYDKAIQCDSSDYKSWYNRGNARYHLNDHSRALQDFNKAISIKPSIADIYLNRGNTYYQLRRYFEAISDFQFALKLENENPLTIFNLGRAYYLVDSLDQAGRSFKSVVDIDADNAAAWYYLGLVSIEAEKNQEACTYLTKAKALGHTAAQGEIEKYCMD
ncbi:MAG: tetratricopeptide repeat protein [Cyclobacteriaceae bacterium]